MSESYIHTHTIILKAGQVLPFQARAINFLPISCLATGDNSLKEFEVAFDQDQSNSMAIGVEVRRKEYFNKLTFTNTNDVDVKLKFQISTDDITDRRLIYNPEVPVPIAVAGGVEVTSMPQVQFAGVQPVGPRAYSYSSPNRTTLAAGATAYYDYNTAPCGFLVQIFTAGKTCTVRIDNTHPIMRISDSDGPVHVPLQGGITFVNDDPDNDIDISITQLYPSQV